MVADAVVRDLFSCVYDHTTSAVHASIVSHRSSHWCVLVPCRIFGFSSCDSGNLSCAAEFVTKPLSFCWSCIELPEGGVQSNDHVGFCDNKREGTGDVILLDSCYDLFQS